MTRTALAAALALGLCSGCYDPLGAAPEEPRRAAQTLAPEGDETHQCGPAAMLPFSPPPWALDVDGFDCDPETEAYCFALAPELRAVAGDPAAALAASVAAFEAHLERGDPHDAARGRAFADLAASGAGAYAALSEWRPTAEDLDGDPRAAARALDRAYRVAWALHGPPAHRASARPALGWIAVSPEDDPPSRPVNVAGGPFPQSDVTVSVPLGDGAAIPVRTRVLVASTRPAPEPRAPRDRVGSVPEEPRPVLPATGDLVLAIHGHSSLAEETAPLAEALLDAYRARGEDVTVIAMDLPSNGYAQRIDPRRVIEASAEDDAVLRFFEAFLEALLAELERDTPDLRDRIEAVIGGSLGGNLVLRLAERDLPWVRRAVAWSPASIDYSWTRDLGDLIKSEAVRRTRHEAEEPERDDTRRDFFVGGLTSIRTQAGYWYRDDWRPCQARFVAEGLVQIGETYDDRLRRWHYRVAYEQLVFSHLEAAPGETEPRFRRIRAPLLLLAGEDDNSVPMQTWFFVERLSPHLDAPGQTLFLRDTGHAMHSERPRLIAGELARFLLD